MRISRSLTIFWFSTAFILSTAVAEEPNAFDHSHKKFYQVLGKHVDQASVDYKALKAKPAELDVYLGSLAEIPKITFDGWSEKQQISFLINLYNAATLRLVISNYPIKSIKKIGSFLKGPWKQEVVKLFGKTTTLDHVEHGLLRKNYAEPRIHFALVCAAKGCPPLRGEPFVADMLEDQLQDQGEVFLAQKNKNRIDPINKRIYLSPIFKWFGEDFTAKSGSVIEFVKPYFQENEVRDLNAENYKISYTDYDWSLNDK